MFGKDYWAGIVFSSVLLVAFHHIRWPRKLRRVEAYILGDVAILTGMLWWLSETDNIDLWLQSVIYFIISGIVVCGCYCVDWALMVRANERAKRNGEPE